MYTTFYLTHLDVIIEVVSTWQDGEQYMEKLKRLRSNLIEKGAKAFDPEPTHFNTMIHGDMFVFCNLSILDFHFIPTHVKFKKKKKNKIIFYLQVGQ